MACTLCELPTPDPPVTADGVDGEYCCRGCLEVARVLDDPADTDPETATERLDRGRSGVDIEGERDGEEAFLSVSGMHCGTCEAFVESRATGHEGVLAASASYPTETVKLTYDPELVDREALPGLIEGLGYGASERVGGGDGDSELAEDGTDSLGRLLIGGFFGMMTMLWYALFLYPAYLGIAPESLLLDLSGPAGAYLLGNLWLMATVVLGLVGYPLFRGAYVSLRAGHPNMDLLVALAAGAAYVYSTAVALLGHTEVYFDVAVVIVLAVAAGNYYEGKIKRRAAGRLSALTERRVDEARRRTADGAETVAVENLEAGDEVVVAAGERVPIDGTVREGTAAVDESLVTGEARPVRREPGEEVVGGGIVTDGRLVVGVEEGATSTLDRVVRVLWDVQSTSPGAQRLADRIAAVFVPGVFLLAAAATAWHLLSGVPFAAALLIGLTVLVVSCPCALGLATPLAVARGIREGLDAGVVVTGASIFETAPDTDVVAFDKTGTLTTGEMRVLDWVGDERVLERAGAVERYADHPVAAAIADAAEATGEAVEDFQTHPGRGVSARFVPGADDGDRDERDSGERAGARVVVGREILFEDRDWTVPDLFLDRATQARAGGDLPVLVGWDGSVRGVVVAGDEPRPEWQSVVADLATDNRVAVLTGDDPAAAERFRRHPAVDEVFADVPPEGKTEVIRRLRSEGTVAMVGDGVNDAPALAAADVGIALDHAALATDAADAVVTSEDLRAVPSVFELTERTNRRIRQNLGWAFCYNTVALPLAVAGALNPLFAAVAMATSSLLVVGNSARRLLEARAGPESDPDAASEPGSDAVPGARTDTTDRDDPFVGEEVAGP